MTALGFSLGDEENVLKLNFGDDLAIYSFYCPANYSLSQT